MIEVVLKRRLSETSIPCIGVLDGVPYSTIKTPAAAFNYYWRWDDDPTMRPEFLCTAEAGVPVSVPFNAGGRAIGLYQVARTAGGTPSDPLIREGRYFVLNTGGIYVFGYLGFPVVDYEGEWVEDYG